MKVFYQQALSHSFPSLSCPVPQVRARLPGKWVVIIPGKLTPPSLPHAAKIPLMLPDPGGGLRRQVVVVGLSSIMGGWYGSVWDLCMILACLSAYNMWVWRETEVGDGVYVFMVWACMCRERRKCAWYTWSVGVLSSGWGCVVVRARSPLCVKYLEWEY